MLTGKLGNPSNKKGQLEIHSSIYYPQIYKEEATESKFGCKRIQARFIRQVYIVLLLRQIITFGFVTLFIQNPSIQLYTDRNPLVIGIIIIFTVALFGFILFSKSSLRSHSTNVCLLGFYGVVESVLLSFIGVAFVPKIMFMAVIVIICVLLVFIVLSFQSKYDFSKFSQILWIIAILFAIELAIGLLFITNEFNKYVAACLLATLYIIYVVYCTQEMKSDKDGSRLTANDSVLTALNI